MEQHFDTPDGPGLVPGLGPERSPERPRRGFTIAAWVVIAILVTVQILMPSAVEEEGASDDRVGRLLMGIQGRYLVGAAAIPGGNGPLLYSQADQFYAGPVDQRQRFVILAGELAGPAEARRRLEDLSRLIEEHTGDAAVDRGDALELTLEQHATQRVLEALYGVAGGADEEPAEDADEAAAVQVARVAALDADDRALLVDQLGWFGELALVPPGTEAAARDVVLDRAQRTFALIIALFLVGAVVGLGGFAGLVTVLVLAFLRKLRDGMPPTPVHHGIYAETFAVWLLLFMLFQIVAGVIPGLPLVARFGAVLVGFFASLVALGWPVWRGVPWKQVREDIGWTFGRAPAVEPLMGVAGYAMALPILAVGIGVTLVFMLIDNAMRGVPAPFDPVSGPAHPIVAELGAGGPMLVVTILLLGSVAAPIVEETMFRGVLYRHLRDASGRLGLAVSTIVSTLGSAFVFAIVHPQGWVAVPALMSLAVAFALIREWRGTLIPAMLMHGISNGIVLGMLVILTRT